jgi:putative tricarboxylic transport membrane protein
MQTKDQAAIGAAALFIGAGMAAGAMRIHGEAGYAGVGPAFLPWVIAAAFALCGVLLLLQALAGGFRHMPLPPDHPPYWAGMAWVSAGLLINAALITRVGFIPSCALLFMLAARGFRLSMGTARPGLVGFVHDLLVGAAISAPVYWLFTKVLGLNLPGLTASGWL